MASEYLNNKTFEKNIIKFQGSKQSKIKHELVMEDLDRMQKKNKQEKITNRISDYKKSYGHTLLDFRASEAELTIAFLLLSENIVKYAKFNLVECEDAIQEGVMICFAKIDHFDPKKGKAFNYMTTCILNHYRQLYRYAKAFVNLKSKYLDHLLNKLEKDIIRKKANFKKLA